jgi:hypothetical protein
MAGILGAAILAIVAGSAAAGAWERWWR